MKRIVLFENIHPSAREVFEAAGFTDIVTHKSALTGEALVAAMEGASAVGIRSRTQFDQAVLSAASSVKVVGCFCIGTNQVDLNFAAETGVPVFNAPFSNTRSVAELVLGEAILLLRRIPEKMPGSTRVSGTSLPRALTKSGVKLWASWVTEISAPRLVRLLKH